MGRAFVGVADDATAAITNPGGLMLLTRPQGYFEFKTTNTLQEDDFFKSTSPGDLSFFGASSPIGTRFSAAFSVHKFFGNEVEIDGESSFEDQGYGYLGSFAVSIMEGVNVGVSIGSYGLSSSDDFFDDELDPTVGFTIGGLFTANEMITVGVNGFVAGDSLVVPARFGVGVGIRPVPRALIATDVVWVGYEDTFVGGENATDFNIGGEYKVLASGSNLVFARAGFFTSSVDQVEVEGFDTDSKNVGTFGAGVVVGRRLQVDFAYLTHGEAVVSAGVRF
jgi:hypothetical protein